ncbi:class I SAM-dependent methyltransferase [Salarchaeum japonicum]|uniref:class I SAM-dependent methyltransferase n=1 Tax=Salarchaeum japonicum TaxID=555573 RepID=UPI003C741C25
MGHHTFDASRAAKLEDAAARYQYVSREELLWALDPSGDETVADLGSGTGFYTDLVASHVKHVYVVDVQDSMHEFYREKGVPENTALVTADIADLPFDQNHLNAAVSTMTYHEFATDQALSELARVLAPGSRLVIADWSADGTGEDGPPLDERFDVDSVTTALRDAGFNIGFRALRPETFLVVGVADE